MTRNADAIGPRERRFLAFVSEMYQEAQRLELKGPYQIVCNDTNGRELFQTKVIGTDGTIVNLETPWKESGDGLNAASSDDVPAHGHDKENPTREAQW